MKQTLKASLLIVSFLTTCLVLPLNVCAQSQPTFVYTNDNTTSNTVTAFSVSTNGVLTQIGVFSTGGTGTGGVLFGSNRVTVSAGGNFLFASNQGSNDVSAFSIDPNTGRLVFVGIFPTGGSFTSSLAATPDGKFLMAGNHASSDVTVFSIATNGVLAPVGSPFPAGGPPDGMKISPNGLFLATGTTGTAGPVAVLSIGSNGALTPVSGSPFQGSGADTGIDIRCSGNQLFAGNFFGDTNTTTIVDVFSLAVNGALTPISGSPFTGPGIGSAGVLLSPNNHFLFVSNTNGDSITVFTVAGNGSLSQVVGSPFSVHSGGFPAGMATNQAGTFLFTANASLNANPPSIGVFSVALDGSLAAVGVVPVPGSRLSAITVFPGSTCSNPVPQISQPLVPSAAAAGGSGFTLTINGTGFVSSSVVNWNGTALPTTVVNGNQLTATVPASNIAVDGTASVTVTNPAPGGGTSNVAFFTTTAPTSSVTFSSSLVGVGSSPWGVVEADFNGDGNLDLATTNNPGNLGNTVSVLLGNGDGTFQSQVTYSTGQSPYGIVVGDFNGDGKLDLAVTNSIDYTVSVLLGNGDGTFQSQVTYPTGPGPSAITVGDFNGDGKLDLAVTNSTTVSILLGNGNGTFQNQLTYATGQGSVEITVGDFNGDGKLDLAVANSADNTVSVLLGNGDGTFQTQVTYATGQFPYGIEVGDFNGDGKLDLAVTNLNGNTVSILLGNGDGTFQTQVTYAAGSQPIKIAASDLNGDSKLDLTVTNYAGSTVSVLLGNGDGTFQNQMTYPTGPNPVGITVGDFSKDGRLDLAIADRGSNTVSILLQSPAVSFSPTSLNCGSQPVNTAVVCSPSIVVTNTGTALLTITSIVPTGANASDFTETDNCVGNSLAPNATCTVQVTFTPTAVGPRSAVLTFTDNAPGSPQTVGLTGTGTGVAPAITTQPASQTIISGQTATLTVIATGTAPLAYQWYLGISGDTTNPIAGATSSSYTTPPLTATTSYWVYVSNGFGNVNSITANISVQLPMAPAITTQPASQTIFIGQTATLSVVATGSQPLSYQWYQGQSGDTSAPVSGATNSSFTTPALMGSVLYWVQVSNGVPPVANSSTSTITVSALPITTLPAPPVFAGQSSNLPQSLTAPQSSVNPLVTFVCTTVSGPNGVQQASDVGITCTSNQVMLSSNPQNVNIMISTTGSTISFLSPALIRRTSYALALVLPGLVFLGMGASGRRSDGKRFFRYSVLGLVCILVVLCLSCGGGFPPPRPSPQQRATPAGSYNITVIDQPIQGTPTGFVQTSLIVPLQVAPAP